MKQIYWDIIEESKKDCKFNAKVQFDNLFNLLKNKDEEFIRDFEKEWQDEKYQYINDECVEFNKLHTYDGGIIDGGDDTFYMDFGNWLFAQGEELWELFIKNGHTEVVKYIQNNNINKNDYTYECMIYVFQNLAEHKGYDYCTQLN